MDPPAVPGAVETRGQEDLVRPISGACRVTNLSQLQAVVLLLIAVLVLATIANRVLIPYPILLVLGGLALSFVPRAPSSRWSPTSCS